MVNTSLSFLVSHLGSMLGRHEKSNMYAIHVIYSTSASRTGHGRSSTYPDDYLRPVATDGSDRDEGSRYKTGCTTCQRSVQKEGRVYLTSNQVIPPYAPRLLFSLRLPLLVLLVSSISASQASDEAFSERQRALADWRW